MRQRNKPLMWCSLNVVNLRKYKKINKKILGSRQKSCNLAMDIKSIGRFDFMKNIRLLS